MNPAQLLAHFDRISDAPDAIPRLRRFILDLAVRGKLVEQDPKDEPASELLRRIQADKDRLIKSGTIRIQDPQAPITEGEIEYALPTNWEPARIGDLLTVIRGASPRPKGDPTYFSTERTPYHWIKISDIRKHSNDRVLYNTDEFLTEAGKDKSVLLPKDTLIVTNSATIGVPIFLGFEGGCIHDGYLAFPHFPTRELAKEFFFMLFQTLQAYALRKARGMAQLNLNTGLVRAFPLGLPPLAEQHRIVAKVDELMALCDRLESAQAERETRRDRLVAASLYRLNNGEDAHAFRDRARFYFNHLPRLTTKPEHIQQLRQTILNLAVRGKLVPQDPSDEHAPEFGIEKEIAEVNRIPLRLPYRWSWTRVKNVAESRLGKMLDKAKNSGKPYQYLRNTNVHWFNIKLEELKVLRMQADEVEKYALRNGDVLICEGGHGIGRTAVWRGTEPKIVFQKALHRVRPGLALNSDFFAYCICVYFYSGVVQAYFTGVGIPHFTGVALSKLVFPLPPLAEQQRIVTKVDELMALCDKIEAQLTTTQTDSRRLLEAVLHEALAPAV